MMVEVTKETRRMKSNVIKSLNRDLGRFQRLIRTNDKNFSQRSPRNSDAAPLLCVRREKKSFTLSRKEK